MRKPLKTHAAKILRKTFGARINMDVKNLRANYDTGRPAQRPPFRKRILRAGQMKNFVLRFWRDETGATAIEYGLIAAGISLAIIAAVNGLGTNLSGVFTSINNSLK